MTDKTTPEPVGEQCRFHDWQVATVYSDAKSMEPIGVWLRCSRCPELCWVSQHDKPSERSLSAEERRQVGKLLEYEKHNYDLVQAAVAANAALTATRDGEARRLLAAWVEPVNWEDGSAEVDGRLIEGQQRLLEATRTYLLEHASFGDVALPSRWRINT